MGARTTSLPMRGAWIEIGNAKVWFGTQLGRSPCGERGLKFTAWHSVPPY